MKKILPMLSAVSLISLASTCYAYNNPGFYLGAAVGPEMSKIKNSLQVPADPESNETFAMALSGADFQLQLGYDLLFCRRFGLGLEFAADMMAGSQQLVTGTSRITYEKQDGYAWNLLPGIYFSGVHLYLPMGMTTDHYQQSGDERDFNQNNFNRYLWGWDIGLGVSTALSHHTTVSARYVYTDSGSFKVTANNADGDSTTVTNKITDQRLLFAVNYHFNGINFPIDVTPVTPAQYRFYVGGNLGYDFSAAYDHLTLGNIVADDAFRLSGVEGGPYIGYRLVLAKPGSMGLAVEAFADYSDSVWNDRQPNASSGDRYYRYEGSYGITLNPSYAVNQNFALYAKLGYVNGHFLHKGPAAASRGVGFNYHLDGVIAGFGGQLYLCQRLAMRLEYDVAWYQQATTSSAAGTTIIEQRARNNQFKLGLAYDLF